jgi:hypothetical protein
MGMTEPRHQHYISECYLKGFAVLRKKDKHQLQVFDRVQQRHYPTAPRNVAGERDFNRLDEGQAEDPNAIEKAYAAFEGELAMAIKRSAEAGFFSSDEDRDLIINMIGLFALRNPRFREQVRSFHEDVLNKTMSLMLSTKERWEAQVERAAKAGYALKENNVGYEEMKDFFQRREYTIELNRGYHIGNELKLLDAILPHLAQRRWWFVRAQRTSGGFVTSDHPVALMWSDPTMRGGFYPPGFGLKGTQVTFPLTSRVAMIGAFEIKEQSNDVPDGVVAQINGATIASSERQVYARDLHFHYLLSRDDGVRKASRLASDQNFVQRTRAGKDTKP